MGPKKEKIAKEPLEAVALIDERLPFQDKIVAGLAENFQQSGKNIESFVIVTVFKTKFFLL